MNPGLKFYRDVLQGGEEWEDLRRTRPTASNAKRIVTAVEGKYCEPKIKGGIGAARRYIFSLIAALHGPREIPKFAGSAATDRGNEMEPFAREAFTAHTGLKLAQVGFITGYGGFVGLSPDSLVISDDEMDYLAGFEGKAPLGEQHVENIYLVSQGELPDDYKQQIHFSLAVTGLPEWHFWSWHPDMKPAHLIVRPDAYTAKVKEGIERFIVEYAELRARLLPQLALKPQTE